MNHFEIELPTDTVFAVFESDSISAGMTKEAPGGVGLTLLPMYAQKSATEAVKLFGIVVSIGGNVALGLFVNWLYDKLKASKRPGIRINRRTVETITPEAIQRVIEEEIEFKS